jgi:hypothetical protein
MRTYSERRLDHANLFLEYKNEKSNHRSNCPNDENYSAPWVSIMETVICWLGIISTWLEHHSGAITALSTVFIALFTIALSVSTKRLWKEAKNAGETADKTARAAGASVDSYRLSERAWVSWIDVITEIQVNARDGNTGAVLGGGVSFRFRWVNSGKTPAIGCELQRQGQIINIRDQIPSFIPGTASQERTAPLLPGVQASSAEWFCSQSDIDAFRAKKKNIFLYARMNYGTVFPGDSRKHTEVCFRVEFAGELMRPDGTQQVRYRYTHVGVQNSAT